jgi:hypothetical protein
MNFQHYVDNKCEVSPESRETLREIQIVVNEALNNTTKINGFGIDDIKFELINEESAETGLQLNLEAKGSAVAKNKEHINGMLQRLMKKTKEPLRKKKIFLEIMYHEIDVHENMYEDNTAIGLKRTLYFNVIAAAIVSKV